MKDGEHNFAIVVLFVYIVFDLFLVVIPTRYRCLVHKVSEFEFKNTVLMYFKE